MLSEGFEAVRGSRRERAVAAVAAALAVALVWAMLGYHLRQRHDVILSQSQQDSANLAAALSEQVSRTLGSADQALVALRASLARRPAEAAAVLAEGSYGLGEDSLAVSLYDASGRLVASRPGATVPAPADVSGEPWFAAMRDGPPSDGLELSRTRGTEGAGRRDLDVARAVRGPGGAFRGALVAALDTAYLTTRFAELDVGPHGNVSLFGRDGYVRARMPEYPGMFQVDASRTTLNGGLFGHLARSERGAFQGPGVLDGTSRVYGYGAVRDFPLVMVVGLSADDELEPLRDETWNAWVLGGAVTLCGLAFTAVSFSGTGRRDRRERALAEAHRARREAEGHYRMLADNASDMIVRLDASGSRAYVSPASRDLLGLSPEAMLGSEDLGLLHPDDEPVVRSLLAREGGDAATAQYRLRHADGRWLWVEASWRTIKGDGDAHEGFVLSVRDVDARRRAQDALHASEARYRTLADMLPQLVWSLDADGTATYSNVRFRDYFGPIGGDRAARLSRNHPDDAEAMDAACEAAARDGRGYEIEGRLLAVDGSYRWHKLVIVPVREGDRLTGWLGTALDIDDIVAARLALEEKTALLELAQGAAGAGTWQCDLREGTVRLSPEAAALLGCPGTAGMPLREWAALVDPSGPGTVLSELARAAAGHGTFRREHRSAPGAAGKWLLAVGSASREAAGRSARVIGISLDATARKEAESALLHAKAQSDAARVAAEQASAAKTDFLASMSHEVRTPLNAVIGYTGLLAESDRLPPDLRRQAELARTAGSALLLVVNDILDFSKVEAGMVELASRPFSTADAVEACLAIARAAATPRAIEVRAMVDPCLPPWLVGDEGRIRQVLMNLLNNAVKFTPEGSVALAVRHEGTSAAGELVRFSVTDTGIGIPADRQHRLFQKFSQVEGSISRDYGGTGLGLAISKSLVELMGGEIGVWSEPGRGSTFWFSVLLPRGAEPRKAEAAPAVRRRSGRLLVVDDVEVNQELALIVLEAAGHEVEVVADGAAAVEACRTGRFDLVLMDIQMPGMDGIEATRRIRRLDGPMRAVPVVAMTANVLPDEVAAFKAAGMDDHVGKPFDREELEATVGRWLGRSHDDVVVPLDARRSRAAS